MTSEACGSGGSARARATVTQKQAGVIFGLEPALTGVPRARPRRARSSAGAARASGARPGRSCSWSTGRARALLAAERTALNFLAHLLGHRDRGGARRGRSSRAPARVVLDTRKTTPGLRALEKAAVARRRRRQPPPRPLRRDPDQGEPHRDGRRDRAPRCAPPAPTRQGCRSRSRCATRAEIDEALAAGATRLLLDNMDLGGAARRGRAGRRARRARGERRRHARDAPGSRSAPA